MERRNCGEQGKITKRAVDALTAADGILWDDELPGFGVRCMESGVKTYILKYRTRGGRDRWLKLGRHGELTPELARRAARREKAAISEGADPSGDLQRKRRENTIAELADRYLAEHVVTHNKPTTARQVHRIVETKIKPKLGRIKITELTVADVKAWHQEMSASPYEANRALAYLSKLLSLAAKQWQLRAHNPCKAVERFPERKRERYTARPSWPSWVPRSRLPSATEANCRASSAWCACSPLWGWRLSEPLGVRWSDVDLAGRTIRLGDAKAGGRTVYLGDEAAAVLSAETQRSGYLIHGISPSEPLTASKAEYAWARLRERAGLSNARLHDLRHTAGTLAGRAGANALVVRDLLGHSGLAMTGRYVHAVGGARGGRRGVAPRCGSA